MELSPTRPDLLRQQPQSPHVSCHRKHVVSLNANYHFTCTGASLQHALEGEVLGATSSASFKLIFICAVVGWMLNSGRLAKDTARVLTQVRHTSD